MTTPSSTPIPSKLPQDLLYNAERFDEVLNSQVISYADRFGLPRMTLAGAVASIAAVTPRGSWASGVSYNLKDVVLTGGIAYICIAAHVSGATFAGDLAAKWRVYQGVLGADLSDFTDASKGPALMGYGGGKNYVSRSIGARLDDVGASPRAFGAVGDGVADDTPFFNMCLIYSRTLDIRNRAWKITSTVALPDRAVINMMGADLNLACGSTPAFSFTGAKESLYIVHGGGAVQGTASCFLFCQGTSNQPTSVNQYARQIRIEGLYITSPTITAALKFDLAVRQVFISKCMWYTPCGIDATTGKTVEVHITSSLFFGATGAAGTYFAKLRSTGGTTFYSEGWHIDTCTIDNYEIVFDVTDLYVMTVSNSYLGVAAPFISTTGYIFQFQAPSTALCESIKVGNVVLNGRTQFVASAGGVAYSFEINGFVVTGVTGTAFALHNNASNINIFNGLFKAGSNSAIGVVGDNNNNKVVCANLSFDGTYANGVVLNGSAGVDCSVGPLFGSTVGDIVGAGRNNIRYVGIPVHSAGVAALMRSVSANLGSGSSYAVGVAIATIPWNFAKGEKGDVVVHLPYSGATAATQNVQIGLPAGMSLESGSGWSAANNYLGATNGLLTVRARYRCSADGGGNVTVTNQAGSTLTVNNQAYCAVFRDM